VVERHLDEERLAITVLCTALPTLRIRAARGFWEDILDRHVAEVSAGGSAVAACRELALDVHPDGRPGTRGGESGIDGATTDWLPPPVLMGDYVCPLRRCARRADRDDHGRPPRCALSDEHMRFVRRAADQGP
jgi:hypothetical protein